MNKEAQKIHAANRERILRERAVLLEKFGPVKRAPIAMSARFSRGVGRAEKCEVRERNCLRCKRAFKPKGVDDRMCPDCSRLPEGFMGV
jgi:hypothetical protein